tara:strand:+ start:360 stop:701 length:342 start_codon:yes stop_codon:yes gene_type:complete
MAFIVGGVTVTGTQTLDATKLTGDLPAISAANLTNIPAGSSIPVVSLGVVGSFACLRSGQNISPGGTKGSAATFFRWSDGAGNNGGSSSLTGTWRIHGVQFGSADSTTCQRIS